MKYPLSGIGIAQNYSSKHKGIDFGWNNNYGGKTAPIYSVADGIVYKIQTQLYGGNVLVIKHKTPHRTYYSLYAHLSDIKVKVGETVKELQQVANMGNTGIIKDTKERVPYHLHFALYKDRYSSLNLINPLEYLFVDPTQTILSNTAKKYNLLKYGETRTCTASTLRIRKAPSLTAKQSGTIKKGDKVKIYEYENGFYKVSKENENWAYAQYLK